MQRSSRRALGFVAITVAALAVAGTSVAALQTGLFKPRLKLRLNLLPLQFATTPQFGDPLTGLNASQTAFFTEGREEFQAVETAEGGLGPVFNGASCVECHSAGGVGGASDVTVTRYGRQANGRFDPLTSQGGSLLHAKAIAPEILERVPAQANVVARRVATPLFGAGLIEAIDDNTIALGALLPRPDGVRGRVARVTDVVSGKSRVGRFGWKAQQASLLAFAGDAYLNEMGITSRFFPKENAPSGNAALLALYDKVPDIEDAVDPVTGRGDIDAAADFMRYLAPPPPLRTTASTLAGSALFAAVQCTACHTPVMFTGWQPVAALSFKPVALYSDLLLHDMGSLGDGIEQAAAGTREMRTAPLWGLRARTSFLHDGRARSVDAAIRAHEGQGAPSRNRYQALPAQQRQQLLDFLGSI
jgi:CxxC motif-containing protein (DUF1111 family)